jgi:hypothetical protein
VQKSDIGFPLDPAFFSRNLDPAILPGLQQALGGFVVQQNEAQQGREARKITPRSKVPLLEKLP